MNYGEAMNSGLGRLLSELDGCLQGQWTNREACLRTGWVESKRVINCCLQLVRAL